MALLSHFFHQELASQCGIPPGVTRSINKEGIFIEARAPIDNLLLLLRPVVYNRPTDTKLCAVLLQMAPGKSRASATSSATWRPTAGMAASFPLTFQLTNPPTHQSKGPVSWKHEQVQHYQKRSGNVVEMQRNRTRWRLIGGKLQPRAILT